LALLVSFDFKWGRAGSVAAAGSDQVIAYPPGFDPVHIFATTDSVPVVKPPVQEPYFALALVDGVSTGVSTGSQVSPAAMRLAIAAARAAHQAQRARFPGDLADAYDAEQSILAFNTMFNPYEGVVTPVSRGWARGGTGYVMFDWDNLFLAWMASFEPSSKDISYSNLIQVIQGRTQAGFVPNYHAGTHDTDDRSEPQLGAQLTLEVYRRYGDAWLVEKLFDTLLGWADWVWTQRLGAGKAPGPLVVLGSDLVFPEDEGGVGTLGAAALESGIDNGAAYQGLDPVEDFDNVTKRMKQYDVGASALFVVECEALVALAEIVNRTDLVPLLRARSAAVATAMETTMWNEVEGVYENTFYNGTWHKRRMPTAFYPMLSGTLSNERVLAMLPLLTSPLGFCVNDTAYGDGDADSGYLLQFYNPGSRDSCLCLSSACVADRINERYGWIRQEGLAQILPSPTPGTLPLNLWRNSVSGDHALTSSGSPPAPGYTLVRREGYCYAESASGRVPITLWYSSALRDFKTCAGNPDCVVDAAHQGYTPVGGPLCWGFNATTPAQLPCLFGVPSVARSDPAFL